MKQNFLKSKRFVTLAIVIIIAILLALFFVLKPNKQILVVYKQNQRVMWMVDRAGPITSSALPDSNQKVKGGSFVSAHALDPSEEDNLLRILEGSNSFKNFVENLEKNGYSISKY